MAPRADPGVTLLVGLLLALAGRATAVTTPAAASAASEPCGASRAGMLRHAVCLPAAAAVTPGWREHVHVVQRLRGGGAVELTGADFPALTHKQMRLHAMSDTRTHAHAGLRACPRMQPRVEPASLTADLNRGRAVPLGKRLSRARFVCVCVRANDLNVQKSKTSYKSRAAPTRVSSSSRNPKKGVCSSFPHPSWPH